MEVYLIRHTKLQVPNEVCYGQTDVETASTFEEEKDKVLLQLPEKMELVISSPLTRCLKLARHIPCDNLKTDPRLMEMNFGEWELKKWDDIDQQSLKAWMDDYVHVAPPGGESMLQMHERVMACWNGIKKLNCEKIAVVSHSGAIRMILAGERGIPLKSIFEIKATYGSVSVLSV